MDNYIHFHELLCFPPYFPDLKITINIKEVTCPKCIQNYNNPIKRRLEINEMLYNIISNLKN